LSSADSSAVLNRVPATIRPNSRKWAPAVLVYTDDPTVERLEAALEPGLDYFAFKPMDLDEIKTALFRLVAMRASRLPAVPHS
jgi:hypothetical protein